jgi:predicted cupin superfamily sugar epimerase
MKPALAEALDLEPHPEGGWFRQTWESPATVSLADGRTRSAATLIYFLLPAGEASAWHRVASDEIWLAHMGLVTLELGGSGARPAVAGDCKRRSVCATAETQVLVPAGHWQRTVVSAEDALVSCLVSPGFDFEDFELAT